MTRSLAVALLLLCPLGARAACELSLLDAGAGAKALEAIAARLESRSVIVTHRGQAQTPRELGEVFFGPGCEAAAQKAAMAVRLPKTAVAPLSWKAERDVVVAVGPGLRPSQLSLAVAKHDRVKAQKLLDAGADPNQDFPLVDALWTRDWDLAALLVERGARTDVPIEEDLSAVGLTGLMGSARMARALIEKAPDAVQAQSLTHRMLRSAIHRPSVADVEVVRVLLDKSTALTVAELTEHLCRSVVRIHFGSVDPKEQAAQEKIARLLIERGANPKLDCKEASLLQRAVAAGSSVDLLEFLIAHGAAIGEGPRSALFSADNADAVRVLLAHKADLQVRDGRGRSALHTVRGASALGALLDAGLASAINRGDARGWTPLHLAVARQDLEGARLLIARGASVDARTTAPSCWVWAQSESVPAVCANIPAGQTPRDLGRSSLEPSRLASIFGP